MIDIIVQFVQLLFPAYLANGSATLLINFKKHPVDFGKKWGKSRIFGDGKTIEGIIFACLIAFLSGMLLKYLYFWLNLSWVEINPFAYAFIGLGAMVGDLAGSFIKRRLNMKRGQNAGLLDMVDFIIGALIFTRIIVPYSIWIAIIALLITPAIHRGTNIIGFKIGIKKEPW